MLLLPLFSTNRPRHLPWLTLLMIGIMTLIHLRMLENAAVTETRIANVCADWSGRQLSDTLAKLAKQVDHEQDEDSESSLSCEKWTLFLVDSPHHAHSYELLQEGLEENEFDFDADTLRRQSLAVAGLVPPTLQANMSQPGQSWNPIRWLTSSLAHSDWWHLGGNMVFFFAFGTAMESLVGAMMLARLMLACSLVIGLCDAVATTITDDYSASIGFSGVLMATIGAMLYLMPHADFRSVVLIGLTPVTLPFRVSMLTLAMLYVVPEIFRALTIGPYANGINVLAHVSGFLSGFAMAHLLLRKIRPALMASLDGEYLRLVRQQLRR